jgi:cytosine/adenosine deaminase-related metal-dependent hydrolase
MPPLEKQERGAIYVASRVFLDSRTVVSPGAVGVSGRNVVAAGNPRDVTRALAPGAERREIPGAALLPGLVNAHTHLQIPSLGEVKDGTAPPSFVEWLLRVIAWKRNAASDEFRRNFDAACGEALSAGTACVGEIAGPDPAAYCASPLRARVFAEGIGFSPEAAADALAAVLSALDILERAGNEGTLVNPGVAPHTLYSAGRGLLERLSELAAARRLPVCLHLAETAAEREFLSSGGGPIAQRLYPALGKDFPWFRGTGVSLPAYLEGAGLLRPGLLLVHNVHLSRDEIATLRDAGSRFVLCPRSNASHGNGVPDLSLFVDASIPFALGTDSRASVPTLSLWDEMRAAVSLYRGGLPAGELCRTIFRAATENGAAALGLPGGTLRPGSPADFIAVDDSGGRGTVPAIRRLVERTAAGNVRLTVVDGVPRYERP